MLKCGAGEGWGRSVELMVWKMKCYPQFRKNNAVTRNETYWNFILVTNCILGHVIGGRQKGRENDEEGVSSYWITVTKGEHSGHRDSDFFWAGNNYRGTQELATRPYPGCDKIPSTSSDHTSDPFGRQIIRVTTHHVCLSALPSTRNEPASTRMIFVAVDVGDFLQAKWLICL